jgi:putative membrane protein
MQHFPPEFPIPQPPVVTPRMAPSESNQNMKQTVTWLALAASLALAACNSSTTTVPHGATDTVSKQDLDFVTYATAIIRFDKEEGQLAQKEAKDPAVLATANKMTSDANYFGAKINPAAARAGIKPPDVLPSDLRVRLGHMRLQQGIDFDKNYVNDQIYSHENNLAGLEDEAANGTVPELKVLAQQAIPVVTENLARLRPLQHKMPM